jgi:hypothetical protein
MSCTDCHKIRPVVSEEGTISFARNSLLKEIKEKGGAPSRESWKDVGNDVVKVFVNALEQIMDSKEYGGVLDKILAAQLLPRMWNDLIKTGKVSDKIFIEKAKEISQPIAEKLKNEKKLLEAIKPALKNLADPQEKLIAMSKIEIVLQAYCESGIPAAMRANCLATTQAAADNFTGAMKSLIEDGKRAAAGRHRLGKTGNVCDDVANDGKRIRGTNFKCKDGVAVSIGPQGAVGKCPENQEAAGVNPDGTLKCEKIVKEDKRTFKLNLLTEEDVVALELPEPSGARFGMNVVPTGAQKQAHASRGREIQRQKFKGAVSAAKEHRVWDPFEGALEDAYQDWKEPILERYELKRRDDNTKRINLCRKNPNNPECKWLTAGRVSAPSSRHPILWAPEREGMRHLRFMGVMKPVPKEPKPLKDLSQIKKYTKELQEYVWFKRLGYETIKPSKAGWQEFKDWWKEYQRRPAVEQLDNALYMAGVIDPIGFFDTAHAVWCATRSPPDAGCFALSVVGAVIPYGGDLLKLGGRAGRAAAVRMVVNNKDVYKPFLKRVVQDAGTGAAAHKAGITATRVEKGAEAVFQLGRKSLYHPDKAAVKTLADELLTGTGQFAGWLVRGKALRAAYVAMNPLQRRLATYFSTKWGITAAGRVGLVAFQSSLLVVLTQTEAGAVVMEGLAYLLGWPLKQIASVFEAIRTPDELEDQVAGLENLFKDKEGGEEVVRALRLLAIHSCDGSTGYKCKTQQARVSLSQKLGGLGKKGAGKCKPNERIAGVDAEGNLKCEPVKEVRVRFNKEKIILNEAPIKAGFRARAAPAGETAWARLRGKGKGHIRLKALRGWRTMARRLKSSLTNRQTRKLTIEKIESDIAALEKFIADIKTKRLSTEEYDVGLAALELELKDVKVQIRVLGKITELAKDGKTILDDLVATLKENSEFLISLDKKVRVQLLGDLKSLQAGGQTPLAMQEIRQRILWALDDLDGHGVKQWLDKFHELEIAIQRDQTSLMGLNPYEIVYNHQRIAAAAPEMAKPLNNFKTGLEDALKTARGYRPRSVAAAGRGMAHAGTAAKEIALIYPLLMRGYTKLPAAWRGGLSDWVMAVVAKTWRVGAICGGIGAVSPIGGFIISPLLGVAKGVFSLVFAWKAMEAKEWFAGYAGKHAGIDKEIIDKGLGTSSQQTSNARGFQVAMRGAAKKWNTKSVFWYGAQCYAVMSYGASLWGSLIAPGIKPIYDHAIRGMVKWTVDKGNLAETKKEIQRRLMQELGVQPLEKCKPACKEDEICVNAKCVNESAHSMTVVAHFAKMVGFLWLAPITPFVTGPGGKWTPISSVAWWVSSNRIFNWLSPQGLVLTGLPHAYDAIGQETGAETSPWLKKYEKAMGPMLAPLYGTIQPPPALVDLISIRVKNKMITVLETEKCDIFERVMKFEEKQEKGGQLSREQIKKKIVEYLQEKIMNKASMYSAMAPVELSILSPSRLPLIGEEIAKWEKETKEKFASIMLGLLPKYLKYDDILKSAYNINPDGITAEWIKRQTYKCATAEKKKKKVKVRSQTYENAKEECQAYYKIQGDLKRTPPEANVYLSGKPIYKCTHRYSSRDEKDITGIKLIKGWREYKNTTDTDGYFDKDNPGARVDSKMARCLDPANDRKTYQTYKCKDFKPVSKQESMAGISRAAKIDAAIAKEDCQKECKTKENKKCVNDCMEKKMEAAGLQENKISSTQLREMIKRNKK